MSFSSKASRVQLRITWLFKKRAVNGAEMQAVHPGNVVQAAKSGNDKSVFVCYSVPMHFEQKRAAAAACLFALLLGFCFARSGKPKVALVLSGGGAKGLAEIPLIEALEAEGIRPDMVLGTSMGALIGSLYASGYSPAQIRQTLLSMDFVSILSEDPGSLEKNPPEAFSQKSSGISFPFSLSDRKFGSAPGLIGDHQILCELNNHLSKVLCIRDFDKLPIPFRAIATDVSTGGQIVMSSGSVVAAVRASISIPAVFTPAPLENGVYAMDGGLKNNFPVKLAREMGADIIISMDVASIVDTDPRTLSDFYSVAVQIFNLIISSNAVEQYEWADVLLRPDLSEFTTLDFRHPDGIIRAGELCVEQNRDKIRSIAQQLKEAGAELSVPDYSRKSDYDMMENPFIGSVEVRSISFASPGVLPGKKEFEAFTGRELDDAAKKALTSRLNRLKDRYHLSSLTYALEQEEHSGACTLEILANHYEQEMDRIFFSGSSSISITNSEPQRYLSVSPNFAAGLYLYTPVESMAQLSFGNTLALDASVFPLIESFGNYKLSMDFGSSLKYGSLEPKTNSIYDKRYTADDRGLSLHGGIRFRHTDYFVLKSGLAFSAEKIHSAEKWFNSAFFYNEIVFTTLHNDFVLLRGGQIETVVNVGMEQDESDGTMYSVRLAGEKRMELPGGRSSAGASFAFCVNRFPYELNSGYCEFGGITGMCGIPPGTFKRDFAVLGLSFRQRLADVFAMPLYGIVVAKASVSDSYDPFLQDEPPSRSFFSGHEKSAGAGIFFALHTFLGNFVVGASVNSSRDWCITVCLK